MNHLPADDLHEISSFIWFLKAATKFKQSSAAIFNINFFEKFFQEYHQSVKQIGSRPGLDKASGLVWIQSV